MHNLHRGDYKIYLRNDIDLLKLRDHFKYDTILFNAFDEIMTKHSDANIVYFRIVNGYFTTFNSRDTRDWDNGHVTIIQAKDLLASIVPNELFDF